MSRTFSPKLRIAVLSVASALFAVAPGCSNGGGGKMISPTAAPLAITNNSRNATPAAAGISAGNARDLAAAQPDTVITSLGGTRDVDLSDGGGGQPVQSLTAQTLGDMMHSMGLNFDVDNGHYILKLKANIDSTDYTFPIEVSVSENRTLIWIACGTGSVDKQGITGESLLDLLVANAQLAPTAFVVDTKHWLVMQRPVTNSGITPQVLGYNLKAFVANLKAAEPLYKNFMGAANSTGGGGGGSGGGGSGGGDNPFK